VNETGQGRWTYWSQSHTVLFFTLRFHYKKKQDSVTWVTPRLSAGNFQLSYHTTDILMFMSYATDETDKRPTAGLRTKFARCHFVCSPVRDVSSRSTDATSALKIRRSAAAGVRILLVWSITGTSQPHRAPSHIQVSRRRKTRLLRGLAYAPMSHCALDFGRADPTLNRRTRVIYSTLPHPTPLLMRRCILWHSYQPYNCSTEQRCPPCISGVYTFHISMIYVAENWYGPSGLEVQTSKPQADEKSVGSWRRIIEYCR
jgi:hypothetical protein